MKPKCDYCQEDLQQEVFVIHRVVWCKKCFYNHILPQIHMSLDDYITAATTQIDLDKAECSYGD